MSAGRVFFRQTRASRNAPPERLFTLGLGRESTVSIVVPAAPAAVRATTSATSAKTASASAKRRAAWTCREGGCLVDESVGSGVSPSPRVSEEETPTAENVGRLVRSCTPFARVNAQTIPPWSPRADRSRRSLDALATPPRGARAL